MGVSRNSVLESLDAVLLILDEVTDDGILMESDEDRITNRILMREELDSRGSVGSAGPGAGGQPGAEDGSNPEAVFRQATQAAKKRLLDSLLGTR